MEKKSKSKPDARLPAGGAALAVQSRGQFALQPVFRQLSILPERYQDSWDEFMRYFSALEERSGLLEGGALDQFQTARRALLVLKEIIRRESGYLDFDEGIPAFVQQFWAGRSLAELVTDLVNAAEGILSPRAGAVASSALEMDFMLRTLLDWYARRKRSLLTLSEDGAISVEAPEDAAIFDLRVRDDIAQQLTNGLEIALALKICALQGHTLWLRLWFESEDGVVEVHTGWESWSSEGAPFSVIGAEEGRQFGIFLPLVPDSQRVILDNVRVFVPAAALKLTPGNRQLVLHATLLDARQNILSQRDTACLLSIPRQLYRGPILPASQVLQVWPHDFSCGDKIALSHIGYTMREEDNALEEVIRVVADLELCGHKQEVLTLHCRMLDGDLNKVESQAPYFPQGDGRVELKRALFPQSALSLMNELEFIVPLAGLKINSAEEALYVELTVEDLDGRVLCGTVLPLPAAVGAAVDSGITHHNEDYPSRLNSFSTLQIASYLVQPEWCFAGGVYIRAEAHFRSEHWERDALRSVFELAPALAAAPSGKIIRQAVCVGGIAAARNQSVMAAFHYHEIEQAIGGLSAQGDEFVCTVKVFDQQDRLLFCDSRKVTLNAVARADKLTLRARGSMAAICELKVRPVESGALVPRLRVAVNYASPFALFGLHYALQCTRAGKSAPEPEWHFKILDFSAMLEGSQHHHGWFQSFVDLLDLDLNRNGAVTRLRNTSLRLRLLSEDGDVLEDLALELPFSDGAGSVELSGQDSRVPSRFGGILRRAFKS